MNKILDLTGSVTTAAGEMTVSYTAAGLYALELPGFAAGSYLPVSSSEPAWLQKLALDLQNYFLGQTVHFTCPWDEANYPPFYQRVLQAAAQIPYGECRTYKWLAQQAGSPGAVRAAGQAMAHNRTPLVIPCHRVLRSDGKLGGFAYGLSWKERLLTLEKAAREDLNNAN
ncbi:MAG TPA: MGMT family protein [Oscillospiraceae bacterium]|nr:MGMT family protein [Oscillospiraceae bacterium]